MECSVLGLPCGTVPGKSNYRHSHAVYECITGTDAMRAGVRSVLYKFSLLCLSFTYERAIQRPTPGHRIIILPPKTVIPAYYEVQFVCAVLLSIVYGGLRSIVFFGHHMEWCATACSRQLKYLSAPHFMVGNLVSGLHVFVWSERKTTHFRRMFWLCRHCVLHYGPLCFANVAVTLCESCHSVCQRIFFRLGG